MSVSGILLYLSLPLGLWLASALLWTIDSPYSAPVDIAMIAAGFMIITSPFWMVFVVYLSRTLVPKLDGLVYPEQAETRPYPVNWLAGFMSLNMYSANLLSARARRKYNLSIDMRQQPAPTRLALRVHVYWMCGINLAMLLGFALMSIYR